jgi:hypothetical protein
MEPLQPFSPKTTLIVPVASLAGLVLGLGFAAALETFGGGASRPNGRGTPTPAPVKVVARIPPMEPAERRAYDTALDKDAIEVNVQGAFSRGIATLADWLERTGGHDGRVFSFAPSNEGQGCSTLVLGLARTMARADKRVLVIDADDTGSDRSLSAKLNLLGRAGLGEAARGDAPLGGVVVSRATFWLLPRGRQRLDMADAATARDLDRLLDKARGHFDVILIDHAAKAGAAASRRDHADLLLLVTSRDRSSGDLADERTAEPGFDGVILNRLASARGEAPMARAV